eukprot:TRINITY_DN769_c1_g1_i1.p1 TRINITY_DN769_c1_g1~~TRINITY_DN769_c1_g1_i1.p1  ORF type:complete len:243 (-),score=59.41 TRINITY_DN769_c1_g1_i1:123-851(-)
MDLMAEAQRAAAAAPAAAMFKVNGTCFTYQAAVRKLHEVQRSSNDERWSETEACTEGEGASIKSKLKCTLCNALLSVSRPSQLIKTHLTERACKGLKREAAAAAAAAKVTVGSGDGGSSSSGGGSSSGTVAAAAAGHAISVVLGKRKRPVASASCVRRRTSSSSSRSSLLASPLRTAYKVASAEMRRGWWDVHSEHFPHIAAASLRPLSFHVTSCAIERNWSVWGRLCTRTPNRPLLGRAES